MIKNTEKEIFLAIDANAIIHRAFHAYPPTLQTSEGLQVNAVYGFTVMLLEALKLFGPKYVLCAMDTHAPTFRHTMFQEYKATRKPTDMSLVDQFPLVEEILKSFNIPVIKKERYEADDILGTVSKFVSDGRWSKENIDLYILSGDRDLLQLIKENVYVCLPNGNFKNIVIYDEKKTVEKFGYTPSQVIDYKGLVGDPSDNIPGIKGVGEKTALELLKKYGTLDEIYKNINDIQGRFKTLIAEGVEQAEFSRELATIDKEVKVDIHLTDCILKDLDRKYLESTFKKYSFKSLMGRLDEIFGKEVVGSNKSQLDMFQKVEEEKIFNSKEDLVKQIEKSERLLIGYISENESLDSVPFLCVRCIDKDRNMQEYLVDIFDIFEYIVGKDVVFFNFEELVVNSNCIKIEHTKTYFDVLLAEHLLHSERRNVKLKDLAFEYSSKVLDERISSSQLNEVLDVIEDSYLQLLKKIDNLELYKYTKESIENVLKIKDNHLKAVLKEIELPVSIILSKMERRGIKVNMKRLNSLRDEIQKEIGRLTKEIYSVVGHEFNINSPKQLSDILFRELDLPNKSKGSTKESVLDSMLGMHPIVEHLLNFREVTKILNTYIEPLCAGNLEKRDSYLIHTDFKQTGTTSGRFSSVNPNMQNLPLDGVWAKRVRECFEAQEGFKFLGMDYSQMELRIMADISNDKLLRQDFLNNIDIHTATAARVLNKKVVEVTHKERNLGKTVNFGMIFGQTAFGLSSLLGIEREIAQKYISAYFENYKGVEQYMRNTEYEAFERGYVQTMFGTTRNISGIRSRNRRMQSAAAREAINMPIQGSEADIMKFVMKKIYQYISEKYSEQVYILLQIHDEIVFEVKEELIDKFSNEARNILLESIVLEVPFDVHISTGSSLADLK